MKLFTVLSILLVGSVLITTNDVSAQQTGCRIDAFQNPGTLPPSIHGLVVPCNSEYPLLRLAQGKYIDTSHLRGDGSGLPIGGSNLPVIK